MNQSGNHKKINTVNCSSKNRNTEDNYDIQDLTEGEKNDENFDEFILTNFVPFTGKQNVVQWLDETEMKFNHFRIVRNLRYFAIPLLVGGEARYKYIKQRKDIGSFDDFYDFLLLHFDVEIHTSDLLKSSQVTDSKLFNACPSCHNKASFTTQPSMVKECNSSTVIQSSTVSSNNSTTTSEATKGVGEASALSSEIASNNSISSENDPTMVSETLYETTDSSVRLKMVSETLYETIDTFVNHLMDRYIFYETIVRFVLYLRNYSNT